MAVGLVHFRDQIATETFLADLLARTQFPQLTIRLSETSLYCLATNHSGATEERKKE